MAGDERYPRRLGAVGHIDGIVLYAIVGTLIEQVKTNRDSKEVGTLGIDAVSFSEFEFCAEECLIAGRHVLKPQLTDSARWVVGCGYLYDRCAMWRFRGKEFLLECHNLVPVLHSGIFAPLYQRVDGRGGEGCRAVALCVHVDRDVGDGHVFIKLVLGVEVNNLQEDITGGVQPFGCSQFGCHRYADDIVGTHLLGNIGGIIVAQSTVNEHLVAFPHGSESTGNRHARPHRLAQHTAVKHLLAVVYYVGGYTGKPDGEGVEVDGVGIGDGEGMEQFADVLADDETATDAAPAPFLFLQPQPGGEYIGVVVLALFQTLVSQVVFVGEHFCPVL